MAVRKEGGKDQNGEDESSKEINEMWNVVYKLEAALKPIMPSDRGSNRVCPKSDTDSCPSGHMLVPCAAGEGYYCKQCSENTFQPNENWITDKCRLRQQCTKPNMRYADVGSTVRDATCACMEGYHFPNEDQRACVPNKVCPKGTAPGIYGNCESCLRKSMYSDTVGRAKKCKPLTNCGKQNRCTIVKSNGMVDNVCGPVVKDLNTCEELAPTSSASSNTTLAITAAVGGFVLITIVILLFIFCCRRRKLRRQHSQRPLTYEENKELQQKVLKESDRDPALCKRVLTTSSSFIEERIGRQIWDLARELFRTSSKQGHYEEIVDKYKTSQDKYIVNGYLREWTHMKGESKDTVAELFRCLRQVKRDDIIEEICLCLRTDVDYHTDSESQDDYTTTPSLKDQCIFSFFPCFYNKREKKSSPSSPSGVVVESDAGEQGTKLLAIATDDLDDGADDEAGGKVGSPLSPGTFYRNHPSPSAPELEDASNGYPSMDNVKYSRQFSQPVQATS